MQVLKVLGLLPVALLTRSEAFTTSRSGALFSVGNPLAKPTTFRPKPVYFFGRNNKDDGEDTGSVEEGEGEKKGPFFARILKKRENVSEATVAETSVAPNAVLEATSTPPKQPESAAEKAKQLRAQAERARLEAERMDAELTLSKIEKLERQLQVAKTKGESIDEIQRQLENLQAKLRGEPPKPVIVPKVTPKANVEEKKTAAVIQPSQTTDLDIASTPMGTQLTLDLEQYMGNDDFEETLSLVENAPNFIKKFLANLMEIDYDTVADLNTTELAARIAMTGAGDFSFSNRPKPVFTESQIDDALMRLETSKVTCPDKIVEEAAGDKRKMAEYILEMEYYIESRLTNEDDLISIITKAGEDEELMKGLIDILNTTALDQYITALYPKCTRKEDGQEPTLAQVQSFASNVLPKVKFQASSKPEKVLGGYIVTGTYNYESGDALIEAIDKELVKTGLADKMTVLLVDDFSKIAKAAEGEEMEIYFTSESEGPLLYIMGTDVVREAKPVQLSIVSGLGFATSWYLSIYPFLLNPALSQRVEEQLAVADAGMTYDLEWLTDLSVPLFFCYLGIQILHEIGHRIAAAVYDVKLSAPTLVPSLVTGITSSVTSFKSLPKNREALFDISLAGPLLGVIASLVALAIGSQLTLSSDPATLPSLPIDILRQSTLGGSIIDTIIQGALYVPDGASSSGLMVSLHPLAVAGYISLIVNALALLPVGTTDGGRMAISMFGRNPKIVLGYLTMVVLLFTGFFGSDLFLFYFAFVIAFQTGNEVPARNEFDEMGAFRIALGGLAYATAFLALVPF